MPKANDATVKAKSGKSLQLNLDRNVTCEFSKSQIVNELLADNIDERLLFLKASDKGIGIIKVNGVSARSQIVKEEDPLAK